MGENYSTSIVCVKKFSLFPVVYISMLKIAGNSRAIYFILEASTLLLYVLYILYLYIHILLQFLASSSILPATESMLVFF